VNEQLRRAESHAARRGWDLVGSWRDDDLSAYSGKPRPGYDALMAEVAAGRVDTIVLRHVDRLWRDDLDAARGRALLRTHRVLVAEYGLAERGDAGSANGPLTRAEVVIGLSVGRQLTLPFTFDCP
jgi:DNA invertase Pin-like site-specific DNA recombinase